MVWPARSPDFNTIGQVLDALGRANAVRQPSPRTLQALKSALLEERELLSQSLVNSLINCMTARRDASIAVRVGHTY